MLELDKCGNCKAFCEAVDLPQHNELTIVSLLLFACKFVDNNIYCYEVKPMISMGLHAFIELAKLF